MMRVQKAIRQTAEKLGRAIRQRCTNPGYRKPWRW